MRQIPAALIWSRLLMGAALVLLSIYPPEHYAIIAISLFTAGLLSDILDGIIARRLGISTIAMRRLDSTIDQIFWIMAAGSTVIHCPDFFARHIAGIVWLIGIEALTYAVSFAKFRREVATHAISSKVWTLILFSTLVSIIATCDAPVLFPLCIITGIVTRAEIIGILLLLRSWTSDVPSIYHAALIRKGKPIKRHKLFNG